MVFNIQYTIQTLMSVAVVIAVNLQLQNIQNIIKQEHQQQCYLGSSHKISLASKQSLYSLYIYNFLILCI